METDVRYTIYHLEIWELSIPQSFDVSRNELPSVPEVFLFPGFSYFCAHGLIHPTLILRISKADLCCLYWSDSSLLDIRQEWRYLGNFYWRGTNMGILWNRYYFHTTVPLNMVPGKVRHFIRHFTNDICSFRALSHFCLVKNSLHSHMGSFKELLLERSFALIICELASNWLSVERHNGVILQTKFLEYKDVTALNDSTKKVTSIKRFSFACMTSSDWSVFFLSRTQVEELISRTLS